jgi:hypothetical protein
VNHRPDAGCDEHTCYCIDELGDPMCECGEPAFACNAAWHDVWDAYEGDDLDGDDDHYPWELEDEWFASLDGTHDA